MIFSRDLYRLMSEAGYFKFPRPQKHAECKHEL